MGNNSLEKAFASWNVKRSELIKRLVSFVFCDTLLYLDEKEEIKTTLREINKILGADFIFCRGVEVSYQNTAQESRIVEYLDKVSLKNLKFIYAVATETRSVLLALLFFEKKIGKEQLFSLAFDEELCQQQKWGITEAVASRHSAIKTRLSEMEMFLNEGSLS